MKLKEWMEFNEPVLNCDFRVKLYGTKDSRQRDRCMINAAVARDVCKKMFGEYEMERLTLDRCESGGACFALILRENQDDIDKEMNDLGI